MSLAMPVDSWVVTEYVNDDVAVSGTSGPYDPPPWRRLGRFLSDNLSLGIGVHRDVRPRAAITAEAERFLPVIETMISWSDKPDDWFGGARRPSISTIQRALLALWANDFHGPLPDVRPAVDGGVMFAWRRGEEQIELEVEPGGTIVTMAAIGDVIETDETDDVAAPMVRTLLLRLAGD
jgi:hypothetical protein